MGPHGPGPKGPINFYWLVQNINRGAKHIFLRVFYVFIRTLSDYLSGFNRFNI
jgi:hypothetical protein